jgi:hypothetical protein
MHQHRHIQHYCNASPLLSFLLPSSHHHRITIATLPDFILMPRNANSHESSLFRPRFAITTPDLALSQHRNITLRFCLLAPPSHRSLTSVIVLRSCPSCSYPSPCQQPSPPSSTSSPHFISPLHLLMHRHRRATRSLSHHPMILASRISIATSNTITTLPHFVRHPISSSPSHRHAQQLARLPYLRHHPTDFLASHRHPRYHRIASQPSAYVLPSSSHHHRRDHNHRISSPHFHHFNLASPSPPTLLI